MRGRPRENKKEEQSRKKTKKSFTTRRLKTVYTDEVRDRTHETYIPRNSKRNIVYSTKLFFKTSLIDIFKFTHMISAQIQKNRMDEGGVE